MSSTQCIVMRKQRFRETSALIHVLSPDLGTCGFVARGFFRKKTAFNSHLEIFSINEVHYRKRDRDGLITMHSASLVAYPERILVSTERIDVAYRILKIVRNTVQGQSANPIYSMTVSAIMKLDEGEDAHCVYVRFLLNYMLHEGILNLDQGENTVLKKNATDLFRNRLSTAEKELLIRQLERNLETYG